MAEPEGATPAAAEATSPVEAALRARLGDGITASQTFRGTLVLTVARERLKEALEFLRRDPAMAFDMLMDIVTVDWLKYPTSASMETPPGRLPRFDVVYNLLSLDKLHRVHLRVMLSEDDPVLPTCTDIWPGANWFEREAYDMMGISFEGHPNLSRILTHPGFTGHALRKDYDASRRQPFAPPRQVLPHE